MAKFYGNIGFADTVEIEPGIWEEQAVVRPYFGDLTTSRASTQNSGEVNDSTRLTNDISILADAYANTNFYKIKYVEYRGVKWKVTSVDVRYPRLVLMTGGVYNGD